jgi:hypothetical protein
MKNKKKERNSRIKMQDGYKARPYSKAIYE